MSDSQTDSVFCIKIKRISQLQQDTFLSSESYVRVRFNDKKTKRKTGYGTMQGSNGYQWQEEPLTFPVVRDTLPAKCVFLELKRRLRFGQSSVLGSAKLSLARLRGYTGIKETAILRDTFGQPVGTIHYEMALRVDTVSSIASTYIANTRQGSMQGSVAGSSTQGSVQGSMQGSVRGVNYGGYPMSVQNEGSRTSHQALHSQGSRDSTNARIYGQQTMSYMQQNTGMVGRPFIPAMRPNTSTVPPQTNETSPQ